MLIYTVFHSQRTIGSMPPNSESFLKKIMKVLNIIKIWSLTIHLYSIHYKKGGHIISGSAL